MSCDLRHQNAPPRCTAKMDHHLSTMHMVSAEVCTCMQRITGCEPCSRTRGVSACLEASRASQRAQQVSKNTYSTDARRATQVMA
jgi:hypothetical protein